MKPNQFLIVGLGGFLGAALRYLISCAAARYWSGFPVGTLIVNLAGGFLMGFVMEAAAGAWAIPAGLRLFLTTGVMGGLTTFSTFSYETVSLLSEENYLAGTLNIGLNLSFALLACWFGKAAARLL